MGELFKRDRPSRNLNFTGERMTGVMGGQIEIEHLHRYFLAREAARGLDVLDIACGEGYGSALMAQVARSVVGVDVSDEAVDFAKRSYLRDNLRFMVGDGRSIPLGDASVDLIASFETLEHLYEQEQLMAEFRRVLRPGGLLLISTPDRNIYSPDGSNPNLHHVRELDQAEFLALVRSVFPEVRLFGQRPMLGSAILPSEPQPGDAPSLTFDYRGDDMFEGNQGLARALYFVAYCSDRPITVPSASLYIETSLLEVRDAEIARRIEVMRVEAASRTEELTSARKKFAFDLADMQAKFADTQAKLKARMEAQQAAELARCQADLQASLRADFAAELESVRIAYGAELAQLNATYSETHAQLQAIEASTFWQISWPIRRFLETFPGLRHIGRRGIKLVWWTVTLQLPRKLRERRALLDAPPPPPVPVPEPEPAPVEATVVEAPAAPVIEAPPATPHVVDPATQEAQARALGLGLAEPSLAITVGVVTYNNGADELGRCLGSALVALGRTGGAGRLLVLDNGAPSEPMDGTERLPTEGNIGFGAGHNRLMREAFAGGAELYVAANPDGAFHPDCLSRLARMMVAHDGRALIEACQFPVQHPKEFDPVSFETPWASGACLAIPRALYEALGGFDEDFFMYCEDVDLSWRARAAGFPVLLHPSALYLHAVTNRPHSPRLWPMMLESGHTLARKWGNDGFATWAAAQLAELGLAPPGVTPEVVPAEWREIPDFGHSFSFAKVRW